MEIQGSPLTYVYDLNPNDVLMGRGAPSAEYSGNLKLRQLVLDHREEYVNCTKRVGKNKISKRIIDIILQSGGKFLHRVTTIEEARQANAPPGKQAWRVVPPSPPLFIKVKQLMRDVGSETQEKRRRRREEKKAAAKISSSDDQSDINSTFPNQSNMARMNRPSEQAGNEYHQQSTRHFMGGEDAAADPSRDGSQTQGIVQGPTYTASSAVRVQSPLNSAARPTTTGLSDHALSPLVQAILWYHGQQQNLYDVLRAVREIEDHPRQDFPQAATVSTELAKVLFQNLLSPGRQEQLQRVARQNFADTEQRLTQYDHEFLLLLQDILNRR